MRVRTARFEPRFAVMLMTSYYLEKDLPNKLVKLPKNGPIDLDSEGEAIVHVLVKFSFMDEFTFSDEIKVLLMIKDLPTPSRPIKIPSSYANEQSRWTEVHRARVIQFTNYTELQYRLQIDSDIELRVFFFRSSVGDSAGGEICHADVKLSDLINRQGIDLEVKAKHLERNDLEGTVSFNVCYLRTLDDRFVCEVKLRVDRTMCWPFNSARIFFFVFTEAENSTPSHPRWLPRWRSDVLTPESPLCDRYGVMHFPLVEFPSSEVRLNDGTNIRIEFFQYKRTGDGVLIGCYQTTVGVLRSTEPGTSLHLQLANFPQSEIVGKMDLTERRITQRTQFYRFKVDFGGKMRGEDVFYFNPMLRGEIRSKHNLYFTLHREPEHDVEIYRSRKPRNTDLGYQFDDMPISVRRLCGWKGVHAKVTLRLFRKSLTKRKPVQIAQIQLKLSEWLKLQIGDEISVIDAQEGIRAQVYAISQQARTEQQHGAFRLSFIFSTNQNL